MKSFKQLQNLAKSLFKKITNYSGIVSNSVIKAAYPGFLISQREHWELLILKLLGRDKYCNKPLETKLIQHRKGRKFLYSVGIVAYGDAESFAGVLSFKYAAKDINSFFRGEIGFDMHRNSWFYSIRKGNRVYVNSQSLAVNSMFRKSGIVQKELVAA